MKQLFATGRGISKSALVLSVPRRDEAVEELHITITRSELDAFLVELSDLFHENRSATIVAHGQVHKTGHAFVLVRWRGLVTEAFRDKLTRDSDIVDFRVYPVLHGKA